MDDGSICDDRVGGWKLFFPPSTIRNLLRNLKLFFLDSGEVETSLELFTFFLHCHFLPLNYPWK